MKTAMRATFREVLDLCFAHPKLCVCDVYDLPVSQNLLGVPGAALGDVKKVCRTRRRCSSAAKFIRNAGAGQRRPPIRPPRPRRWPSRATRALAAIASQETAALYGLAVLAENINTSEDNTTRFIVIGKGCATGNRFSLLFTVDHRAGRLARVMQVIGEMGFNLECIKSRPMPHVPWEYYFYVELVGDLRRRSAGLLEKLCACAAPCVCLAYTAAARQKGVSYI